MPAAENSDWGTKARYGEFEIVGAAEGRPRLLGEGSFGKTYEAMRTDTVAGGVITEHVGLKVLNPALLASESKRFQFIQELVALTKFKHPNLIHYIRCGEEGGEVYYAMELCRGGDLLHLVRRYGTLPERVAALAGLQIARGLKEVHQRHRLVHRDIKPSNVMILDEIAADVDVQRLALHFEEQESLCRIVDFGLVDFTLHAQDSHSHFVGSPMYASPEQIREQPVDGRSDIYSLGMTLWFLVQGKGPLLTPDGRSLRGVQEVMRQHTEPEEHTGRFPPHLSEAFQKLLAKMVAKRPEERFGSAGELQTALREYLAAPKTAAKPRFTVTKIAGPLEAAFEVHAELPPRAGGRRCVATRKNASERFRLTFVAAASKAELARKKAALCDTALLAQVPGLPAALMPIREVFAGENGVAFREESAAVVSLADVLTARAAARRPVVFGETTGILGPVAEGLEFLLQRGRGTLPVSCDELWLEGVATAGEAVSRELGEWLAVRMSMIFLEDETAAAAALSTAASTDNTVAQSTQGGEADLHPVPCFARLVYRIASGGEMAMAAQFSAGAYVPAESLSAASNHLLRDLVCRRRAWTSATAVLAELCRHEGVAWQPRAPGAGTATAPGTASTPTGFVASATPTGAGGSGAVETRRPGQEKTCEVIAPGLVSSPHSRQEQRVAPEEWVPAGKVRCVATGKTFKLPRRLAPLFAEVLSPGVIRSPYAAAGETQRVPWEEWIPGGEVVCGESGKRLALPSDLALPEGILPIGAPGRVLSPYQPAEPIEVPPEQWEPKTPVSCPATGFTFLLPATLPPLEAVAKQPGVIATPYAPAIEWPIPPAQWRSGTEVACPFSRKPLRLPAAVDRWPVAARVVDAAKRLVANPCREDAAFEVPRESWRPGQEVACAYSGRPLSLPRNLPPLVAAAIEEQPGVVISPYTGDEVAIDRGDWFAGARVTCPRTSLSFLLPPELPEWLACGTTAGLAAGQVRSPFEPFALVRVPPDQWLANGVVMCPETERAFRLPQVLAPLVGAVERGRFGEVRSPFSGEWQEVTVDDWKPGATMTCETTRQPFLLPDDLAEWIPDGHWVEGRAGRIRSPFRPGAEMEVRSDQVLPGTLLTCPASGRRFRAPEGGVASVAEETPTVIGLPADVQSDMTVEARVSWREPAWREEKVEASAPPPVADEPGEATVAPEAPAPIPAASASSRTGSASSKPAPPPRAEASHSPGAAHTDTTEIPHLQARRRRTRWPLMAALAGLALGIAGLSFWLLKDGATVPDSPVAKHVAMAIVDGALAIEDWSGTDAPPLRVFYKGRACDDVQVAPHADGAGFRVQASLPRDARGQQTLPIAVQLAGWESREFTLTAEAGDFVLHQPMTLPRRRVRLPITVPKDGADYEFIRAKWLRPLAEEPGASPPPGGAARIPINDNAEDRWAPSGVYELTLEGREGDRTIAPHPWHDAVALRGNDAPLAVPPTIAGSYFGLMTTDERVGNFFRVTIGRRPLSVRLDEVEFNKQPKFRASDGVPFIGASAKVAPADLVLESPVRLKFSAPIFTTAGKWTFLADERPFPKLLVSPAIPAPEALESSRLAMIEAMRKDAEVAQREGSAAKFRDYADFARSGFKLEKLRRYETFLATPDIYRQRMAYLRATVEEFRRQFGTDGLWLNMYPAASTLSLNPTNKPEVWDVWIAP